MRLFFAFTVVPIVVLVLFFAIMNGIGYGLRWIFDNVGFGEGAAAGIAVILASLAIARWLDIHHPLPPR